MIGYAIQNIIRQFIGEPPAGFEWLEYVAALTIFLLLFRFCTDLFRNVASWLNMRR